MAKRCSAKAASPNWHSGPSRAPACPSINRTNQKQDPSAIFPAAASTPILSSTDVWAALPAQEVPEQLRAYALNCVRYVKGATPFACRNPRARFFASGKPSFSAMSMIGISVSINMRAA